MLEMSPFFFGGHSWQTPPPKTPARVLHFRSDSKQIGFQMEYGRLTVKRVQPNFFMVLTVSWGLENLRLVLK